MKQVQDSNKIVPPHMNHLTLRDLIFKKIEGYQESFEEIRNYVNFSSIENLHIKNKIQIVSLDLLKDMSLVVSWKLIYPKIYQKDLETFLEFVTSSRWLLHLFNSTENIYG